MVFKRRDKPPLRTRIFEALLPRRGWRRGIEYIAHRLRRLPDTPHRIALGFACGVFASFTPFFGIHLIGAIALAWLIRGNLIAAAIGQFVGNPFTLPFIAWISMALGPPHPRGRRHGPRLRAGVRRVLVRRDRPLAIDPQPLRHGRAAVGRSSSRW